MRHIAILGMSFCGSTLLGRVLGALPGVAHIGESHWISTPPLPGRGPAACVSCGGACPVLTQSFFEGLRTDPSGWYRKIGKQMGTELLVSSDKNFDLVTRLDPSLDLDAILLFRFPIECWHSYCSSAHVPPEDGPLLQRQRYFWYWTNFYGHALYNFRNMGRFVVVDYDAFVASPVAELERLCGRLQLPFSGSALEYWSVPQHTIAGNVGVNAVLRNGDHAQLRVRPRDSSCSRGDVVAFSQHPTVAHMHSYLIGAAQRGDLDRTG